MSGITLNLNFHEPNYDEGQQKSRGNRKHRGFVKRRRFLEQNGLLKKNQNANNCQKGACRKKPWHGRNKKKKDSQTCALYPKSSTSQAELSTNPSSSLHNRRENSVSGTIKESTKPSSSESQRQSSTMCRVALLPKKKQNANNCQKGACRKKPWHGKNNKKKDSQTCALYPKSSTSQTELSTNPPSSLHNRRENSVSGAIKEFTKPSSSESQRQSSTMCRVATSPGNPLKYIAIDCEMVGTGPKGQCSELARCSIVSYDGNVIYDKFVKPVNPVTDLRTRWSGVRWQDLRMATPFRQAQREILKILSGKVVVGHAIHNDLRVLHYSHPACLIRDTSRIPILNQKAGLPEKQTASLKKLTKILFNKDIQMEKKGHSSVEDAKATMELYKVVQVEWERTLASKPGS